MKQTVIGPALPNIPWEEKPKGYKDIVWRSKRNPIITMRYIPSAHAIFNSAVVPFMDGFAGAFRVDTLNREFRIHAGKSGDGINWEINDEPISFICDDPEIGAFIYGYDPRVCKLRQRKDGS